MAYTNWKDHGIPFQDFTEELTYEWMSRGFNWKKCKEWLYVGMKKEDAGFCSWLRDELKASPLEILNNCREGEMREQYGELLESKDNNFREEVIKKIKNSRFWKRESTISKLMLSNELKKKYKMYKRSGLCKECRQLYTGVYRNRLSDYCGWCQSCNAKHFKKEFSNWTSGNLEIDELIQQHQLSASNCWGVLEWIPYDKIYNVKYLAEGGFGKVYKVKLVDGFIISWDNENNKWKRDNYNNFHQWEFILKTLKNSQDVKVEFLQEITNCKIVDSNNIVRCFGISQDPTTKNYAIVMDYISKKNLRQSLNKHYRKKFLSIGRAYEELSQLYWIVEGLKEIHSKGLIHRDLHPGNILNLRLPGRAMVKDRILSYITDFGLCCPANEVGNKKVYGVLPYLAPEVLRGKPYTQASDIYSLGMVMCEVLLGKPPYCENAHEEFLAIKICQGLRPNLDSVIRPQLLKDLISKCLDADPKNRPTVNMLHKIISDWLDFKTIWGNFSFKADERIYWQYNESIQTETFKETMKELKKWWENRFKCSSPPKSFIPRTHPQAIYTSRLLDFKNLPEPQNSKEINEQFWNSHKINISQSVNFPLTELQEALEEADEQKNNLDWQNINPNFTSEQIQSWQNLNFTSNQCKEWLDIGLQPSDHQFASYLHNIKHLTPEAVLNQGNYEQLRTEFQNYQLQSQQDQPPKNPY